MMMMMVCEQEYRAQQKLVDQELRDLTVEHELLLQAFQKVNLFLLPSSSCSSLPTPPGVPRRCSRSVTSC